MLPTDGRRGRAPRWVPKNKTSFSFPLAASHFIIRRLLTKGSLLSDRGGETRFYSWVYGGWRAATNSPVERDRKSPPPPSPLCEMEEHMGEEERTDGRQSRAAATRENEKAATPPVEAEFRPSGACPLSPSLPSLLTFIIPPSPFLLNRPACSKKQGGGGVEIGRFAAPPPPHSSRQQHHHHHCCMQSFLLPPPPLFFFSFLVSFPSSSCARIHYPK